VSNAEGERVVDVDGQCWRVLQRGRGAPCWLLLHGTGASIHSWRAVAERLAAHASVVVPDLPGHALTALGSRAQLTLPGMARAVAALLRALGVEPDCIAGHSAGAAVAARLVLDGLAAPRVLVAVNGAFLPFGGVAAPLFTPLARALYAQRWVPRLFARRAADVAVIRRLVEGTGSRLDDAGLAAYQQLMRQPAHAEAALGMMAHWDLRALERDLPRLQVPLWLLVGTHDRAVSPKQAERVALRCAQARVARLDGLGHLAQEEDPPRVAQMLQVLAERPGSLRGPRV
jgi:magnesium chelatase accessory protein